jgi:mono/diheme cytochrome c family protein
MLMQPAPIIARKIAGYRDKPKGCTTVFDRRLGITLIFLMLALGNAHPARAAAADNGAQLARQWCANCHVISNNSAGPVPQGPPSFQMIAHSGLTVDQLRAFLSHPHGAMPDLSLTRTEIDELIAYINTLR